VIRQGQGASPAPLKERKEKTMKKSFEMIFNAPENEQVEQAVRIMDTLFRRWYNVHGGKRVYSGKGAGHEYYVFMEYTADWDASGLHIWPDFDDLRRALYRKLAKVDRDDMIEIHSRVMP
jgi:hypothetical protein